MAKHPAFEVSRHARLRMKQRGISTEQVRKTLDQPDRREPDVNDPELTHALKRFHRRGGSLILRVVYNHVAQPVRIVTAFFDRRLTRKR